MVNSNNNRACDCGAANFKFAASPPKVFKPVHHAGRIEGMEPLRDAAVRKLADGVTTFEEIVRVTADTE